MYSTLVKISQVVTGLLPGQRLSEIVILHKQHCLSISWLLELRKFVLIEQTCSLLLTCLFQLIIGVYYND